MNNIEVELRSFVTKEEYDQLINYFNKKAKYLSEESQITYYYNSKEDLRIQQSDQYAKIWLKKGKIHENSREEIEIKCHRNDFLQLHELFTTLGYKKEIEWQRIRKSYAWNNNITITIDYTKGYGYIIEMEILTSEDKRQAALALLKDKFKGLSIAITPKKDFDLKYLDYKKNWRKLLNC